MPISTQQTGTYGTTSSQQTTRALTPKETAEENLAAIPGLSSLTSLINAINQSSQQAANLGRVPGEPQLETQSSQNIASALRGELPQDVVDLIAQRAAERSTSMGMGTGAPISNAELLSALGLTSLDLMGTGQNWLTAATGRNPAAQIYGAQYGLVTPSQAQTTATGSGTQSGSSGTTATYPSPAYTVPTTPTTPARDNSWWNSLFPSSMGGTTTGYTYPEFTTADWLDSIGATGGQYEPDYWQSAWEYMGGEGTMPGYDTPYQYESPIGPEYDYGTVGDEWWYY